VGRKMISKMKIGGRKITAAMERISTGSQGEKRSSGDVPYARTTDETSPLQQMRSSPDYSNPIGSPVRAPTAQSYNEPLRQNGVEYPADRMTSTAPVGLGPSTPIAEHPATFSQMHVPEAPPSPLSYHRPETPVSPARAPKKGHGSKPSISGGKVSKFFGVTVSSDLKPTRNSAEDSPPLQQQISSPQTSPKPSKFSKFMADISSGGLSGTQSNQQQSGRSSSPLPPPPPPKSQYQKDPATRGGGLKSFFADISTRDALGNKPGEKPILAQPPESQISPRLPKTSPRATDGVATGSGGGFSRFFSDISKRDLSGHTEQEKAAALAKKGGQEKIHVPAQPVVYDESASDFEVKIGLMQDVLPHISRDVLVDSLKQAGGDERKGIGIAVLGNYGS